MEDVAADPTATGISWYFRSLGPGYSLLLPLIMLVSFTLVAWVCFRCRNGSLTALLALLVPLPLFFGIVCMLNGYVSSYQVIALAGLTLKPEELAEATAMSLFGVKVSLWLSLPGFLLATSMMVYRALTASPELLEPPGFESPFGP